MNWRYGLLYTTAFVATLLAADCRAGDPGDYLTEDGKLKEAVTLRHDTVGLAPVGTPKGEVWVIQPTGDWTSQVAGTKGKLSAKQLAALAQHLATQDFNSLPQTQGYKQQAIDEIYQRVVIGFGKKSATFHLKMGTSQIDYIPKPGDAQAARWSRFVALELVLTDLLQTSEIKGKQEKQAARAGRIERVGLSRRMAHPKGSGRKNG